MTECAVLTHYCWHITALTAFIDVTAAVLIAWLVIWLIGVFLK